MVKLLLFAPAAKFSKPTLVPSERLARAGPLGTAHHNRRQIGGNFLSR
jgi:hypothetical protein